MGWIGGKGNELAINLRHAIVPCTKGLRDRGHAVAGGKGEGRHF